MDYAQGGVPKFKIGDKVQAGVSFATVYEIFFSYCVEYFDGGFGSYNEDEMEELALEETTFSKCDHLTHTYDVESLVELQVGRLIKFTYCPKCGEKL